MPDAHEPLIALIEHIEANAHSLGWRVMNPMLYRIEADSQVLQIDPTTHVEFLSAVGLELEGLYGSTPEQELAAIASISEDPATWLLISHSRWKRPVAHFFLAEGWLTTRYQSTEEYFAAGVELKDLTDAKEVRYAVGIAGSICVILYRCSGEEPQWIHPDRFGTPSGNVRDYVRRLHLAEVENWKRHHSAVNN